MTNISQLQSICIMMMGIFTAEQIVHSSRCPASRMAACRNTVITNQRKEKLETQSSSVAAVSAGKALN